MSHQDIDVSHSKGWHLYTNKNQGKCICSDGAAPPGYSILNTYVSHPDCSAGLVIYCHKELNIGMLNNNRGNMKKMAHMKKGALRRGVKMMGMMRGLRMNGMVRQGVKMMGKMKAKMKKGHQVKTWTLVKGMDGNCHCIDTKPDSSKIVLGTFHIESNCKDHIDTDC